MSIPGLEFRFYEGGEDQLPDPLIEAAEGHGRTPAFRGLAYLVFEDLPLENFGNRIPNITAEVTFNAQEAYPALKSTNLPGGALDSVLTGDVSKACWFLLCSDASVGYAEASEAQGDPPCPVLIRPNSAACSPA